MKRYLGLVLSFIFWTNMAYAAFAPFQVQDIRLEGIQRIEPEVVFRNFPVSSGDVVTQQGLSAAVKRLYQAGYFQDISTEREGDVLILKIIERPAISKIRLKGNKVIKDEALLEGLEHSGLKEGVIFKRSALEQIKTDLKDVYVSQGRYNAVVGAEVERLTGNRIALNINIKEGSIALINHINIVGNTVFSDDNLMDLFESELPSFWAWFSDNDRYSKERLDGDIERLRSYYLDRGYLNFDVTSTQVSISPDKKSVFLTVNVDEGAQFRIGSLTVQGDMVVPETELLEAILLETGAVFSRSQLTESGQNILNALGNSGYMFAQVQPIPNEIDDSIVDIVFGFQPGKRTYVRRINIIGNEKTSDIVIRRQFQQMEAALASSEKIEDSKVKLSRTGYFADVDVKTTPVQGTDDQIDIDLIVEEQPSGNFIASVGYSGNNSVILDFGISQDNFFGTGNRVSANVTTSDSKDELRFEYLNPFYTVDGVSRGFNFSFLKEDFAENSTSRFKLDETKFGVTYGYPIADNERVSLKLEIQNTKVTPATTTSSEVTNYIADNGDNFTNLTTTVAWTQNKFNRGIFPTKGYKQSLSLEVSVPGSDLSFYRAFYNGSYITPINKGETLLIGLRSKLGYADSLNDKDYPFFKNYFAGGIGSVRGFSSSSLGPRDSLNDPIGGNVLITGGADFVFPFPGLNDPKTYRTSLFFDYGGIFATDCLSGATTSSTCNQGVNADDIKYSAGFGFTWVTPFGPLTFSYANPLNDEKGDETKQFDFTLGGTF